VFWVMIWLRDGFSLFYGTHFLDLRAWAYLGDYSWWFLEHIMRRLSTFEVILHIFMSSFHLEERNIGTFLAWEAKSPCFEASTSLFLWNLKLGEKICPIFCGIFLSHESFLFFLLFYFLLLNKKYNNKNKRKSFFYISFIVSCKVNELFHFLDSLFLGFMLKCLSLTLRMQINPILLRFKVFSNILWVDIRRFSNLEMKLQH